MQIPARAGSVIREFDDMDDDAIEIPEKEHVPWWVQITALVAVLIFALALCNLLQLSESALPPELLELPLFARVTIFSVALLLLGAALLLLYADFKWRNQRHEDAQTVFAMKMLLGQTSEVSVVNEYLKREAIEADRLTEDWGTIAKIELAAHHNCNVYRGEHGSYSQLLQAVEDAKKAASRQLKLFDLLYQVARNLFRVGTYASYVGKSGPLKDKKKPGDAAA